MQYMGMDHFPDADALDISSKVALIIQKALVESKMGGTKWRLPVGRNQEH
jgi:hypothetical protein